MWGNKKKTFSLIMKILAGLLSLVLLAGLYYAYKHQRSVDTAEKHEYTAVYEQHTQNEEEEKQLHLERIPEEYERDLAVLERELPGIVCWGDTLTVGTTGGVSYPSVLQRLINENICDAFDFRLQMSRIGDYSASRIDWSAYTVSVPVVNMGVTGESATTVAGRCGAMPYLLNQETQIPADCTPVSVMLTCALNRAVSPLEFGESGINDVTIAGVTGKLARVRENRYEFTRNEPGEAVTAPKGTEIITACTDLYRDFIPVILIGTYGGYTTPEEYVAIARAMIERHQTETGRFLIIGPFTSSGGNPGKRFEYVEQALQEAFGERFINARKYFCSDGMTDAKLTATKKDSEDVKQGTVPSSLRNPLAPEELNATGYELLGKLVYKRMDQLGWFDAVRQELGIEQREGERP